MGAVLAGRSAETGAIDGAQTVSLGKGQLDVWATRTGDEIDSSWESRLHSAISGDEQKESRRFRDAEARHQFVIGRALARCALSHYYPVPTAAWKLERDGNGKPFVSAPAVFPAVHLSLSHTRGLVVCLITLSAEAAVDVERTDRCHDVASVAGLVLSLAEQDALEMLAEADRRARFFDLWTLKEAYSKARGLGLTLPFSDIGFDIGANRSVHAHFTSRLNDDPEDWEFWSHRLPPEHVISVAVKREVGETWKVRLRPVTFEGAVTVDDP